MNALVLSPRPCCARLSWVSRPCVFLVCGAVFRPRIDKKLPFTSEERLDLGGEDARELRHSGLFVCQTCEELTKLLTRDVSDVIP